MKIEKGVPLPGKRCPSRSVMGATVRQMDEGDSLLLDTVDEASSARGIMRSLGWKACQRKVAGGWRVWRVPIASSKPQPSPTPQAPRIERTPEPQTTTPPDQRALDLHGLAVAFRVRASMEDAQRWAACGVSDEDLKAAIAMAKDGSANTITQLLEAA